MRLLVPLLLLWPVGVASQAGPATHRPPPAVPGPGVLESATPAIGWPVLETPGGAFTASLILPGAGQAALGVGRWVVYPLLEAAFWTLHLEAASDVRRLSTAYRDLAWEEARVPTDPGPRQDGSWGYYETMSQFITSGAYDLEPGTRGLQPEVDESTYNGSVWSLAQGLFLPPDGAGPGTEAYERALDYYREGAAGPAFLWSWSRLEDLERFRGLIDEADAEARLRSTALGLVLANHLVSAVDALVVARLRPETGVRLESRLTREHGAVRMSMGLRIPVPD